MRHRPAAAFALLAALAPGPAATATAAAGRHPATAPGAACVAGECHAAIGRELAGAASAHEPAAGGECGACHDLALPAGAAFVTGCPPPVPGAPRLAGGAWELALCGACHGEKLGAKERPAAGTAFAESGRDLHVVHVRASGKGRACLSCHAPHAAPQARLLRDKLPAIGATIPQRFEARPKGGFCRTGCHAPKSYARD